MNTFSFNENREMNHIRFYFPQIDKYKKVIMSKWAVCSSQSPATP